MTEIREYRTPGGRWVRMAVRPNTVDEPVIAATSIVDEYGVAQLDLKEGDLYLDVGAYIGSVGLAVAQDFPQAKVVMVEAIPENVAVIAESIAINGWGDRVWVYNNAAAQRPGTSPITFGSADTDTSYQRDNRYIGNLGVLNQESTHTIEVTNITLGDIIRLHGIPSVLKIDCEGCEYGFLASPEVGAIPFIVGEQHDRGQERILKLLGKTHDITFQPDTETVGLFWAKRR